jgi:hypothetical protein
VVVDVVVRLVVDVVGAVVVDKFCDGVIDTSWKTPFTSLNTTTSAGALVKPTLSVPVPCPPVVLAHALQVMFVTVVVPFVHPTVSIVGRTCGVDPGPQDSTAGCVLTVVVEVEVEVVVDACPLAAEATVEVDLAAGGAVLEPTVQPMATPPPRAARIARTMPSRTTVLRRTVMSRGSLCATTPTVVRTVTGTTNGVGRPGRREDDSGQDHQLVRPIGPGRSQRFRRTSDDPRMN